LREDFEKLEKEFDYDTYLGVSSLEKIIQKKDETTHPFDKTTRMHDLESRVHELEKLLSLVNTDFKDQHLLLEQTVSGLKSENQQLKEELNRISSQKTSNESFSEIKNKFSSFESRIGQMQKTIDKQLFSKPVIIE